jgi:hypothetical protein
VSSFAKDNRIKSLEEMVLNIGYDPLDVKLTEELLKKKNVDIASLRKQLKLTTIEDSQTKEIVGQLRGGVNQLLPCLNNYASFKIFIRHSMMITIMQGNKQWHIQHQSHI